VLSGADEVVRFLEAIPSLKSRTALTTVYAAGLRVSDVSPCATHPRSGRLAGSTALAAGPLSQWLYGELAEVGVPMICVETCTESSAVSTGQQKRPQ
jgi:hypothetical protein